MGLDITAYANVTLRRAMTVAQANAEGYDPSDEKETLLYVDHPSRTQHDGMEEGIYEYEDCYRFRAGSYSGYNEWRYDLARLVGRGAATIWKDPTPGPFVELINFADNEGFMGPTTSAKLAADFDEWEDRARLWKVVSDEWFFDAYQRWSRAFHLAAHTGAVKFH